MIDSVKSGMKLVIANTGHISIEHHSYIIMHDNTIAAEEWNNDALYKKKVKLIYKR